MKYTRHYVEQKGKFGAGIIGQTNEWYRAKILNEIDIYCRKDDDSVTPCLINDGFWEAWITAWFLNEIEKPGTVFFDVGANTGYYSFLAHSRGALVRAFEPNPKYTKMMRASKELNGIGESLRISECALSDEDGAATLNIPKTLHGSASLGEIPGYEVDQIEITTRRLDTYVAGAGKHLIKVDAEGAEEKILMGGQRFLRNAIPHPTIMLEYSPGKYSHKFVGHLFDTYQMAWINHAGGEEAIDRAWVEALTDWAMLVLRKR